jgi:N,N'-diacetyllegionaminate synthase
METSIKPDPEPQDIVIGDRRVGAESPVFVMAEAGVNHDGSLEKALRLVDVAADAGADAVKFQVFRAAELVAATAPTAAYQKRRTGETSQAAMLARLELSDADFAAIKQRCDERSVLFTATPFGPSDVARLLDLGVAVLKTASTNLNDVPLLGRAAESGLPLIVSTGASTKDEIQACVDCLTGLGARDRLILLHCVSVYPTPVPLLNLRAIASLRQAFGVPVGLSDHTDSTETGAWAAAVGACVVEKHMTLDRRAPGPDHAMSMDPDQLHEYVDRIRQVESGLGDGRIGMTPVEDNVRRVARKSIVASASVPAGTVLTEEMLTCKRPGTGITPIELRRVIGRSAAMDIPADAVLTWDMLQ